MHDLRHSRTTRRAALAAGALSATLALAGCGGDDSDAAAGHGGMTGMPTSAASPPVDAAEQHNAADVAFATQMIPHHAQAVQMSDMALEMASTDEVRSLAEEIKAAQDPEIQQMAGWLEEWGEPVPATTMGGTDHGAMGHGDMPGMMSDEEMRELGDAMGDRFDLMWLTMMIEHHEGAITMAEEQLRDGEDPAVKELAQRIIDAQQAEIDTMQGLVEPLRG